MGYPTQKVKSLQIKFDSYGAGDDKEFKYELIMLMTGSIRELKAAASQSCSAKEPDFFKKAVHKAKSTLTLINDHDFNRSVDEFNLALIEDESSREIFLPALGKFNDDCEIIIASLGREAERLKNNM